MSNSFNSSSLLSSINTFTTNEFAAGKSTDETSSIQKSFFKSKKKSNIKEAIIAEAEQEKKELKADPGISALNVTLH